MSENNENNDWEDNQKITVIVSSTGAVIHSEGLTFTNIDAFDEVYKKSQLLLSRIPFLDDQVKKIILIGKAKDKVQHFWNIDGENVNLTTSPDKPEYRIALSLLRTYPKCKREIDIVREIGVLQKTANNHLRGDRKATEGFFSVCEGGYSLSDDGIDWIVNTILPELDLDIE
ncbi:MAG: hypothetical protein RTV31_16095 [Candidatus Thorarchaeota archaeon]